MTQTAKLAVLQINSGNDVATNLAVIEHYMLQAQQQDVKLLLLPENFAQMPRNHAEQHVELVNDDASDSDIEQGQMLVQRFLAEKAAQYDLYIVAGSLAVKPFGQSKPVSRCMVFDNKGRQIAHYDKIHLYDVNVPNGQQYKESATYQAGSVQHVPIVDTPFGIIGLSICYDLRFPEFYRALVNAGAQIVCVPAAFTYQTGQAHWQTLLQARAIENLSYVLASGQTGTHANGRQTWGHSMIINPWGELLAQQADNEGLVISEIDLTYLSELRDNFPVLQHARL